MLGLPMENKVDRVPVPAHSDQERDRINNTISAGTLKEIHRVTGQTELDGERGYFRVSRKISRKGGQIGLLAVSTEGMVR